MTSWTRRHAYWTETKRIVDGQVKATTCCCARPGGFPRECATSAGNKTPCRCDCHRGKPGPVCRDPLAWELDHALREEHGAGEETSG